MKHLHNWVAVGGVFIVLAVGGGISFYAASAFIKALVDERGLSLPVASAGPTLSFLGAGLGGMVVARLLPRLGVRRALLIGAAGTAVGLVVLGSARTAWPVWLAFVVLGGVGGFMAIVPCTSLIARWFAPNATTALTVATTGMSAGGALVAPLVVVLIDRYGLRDAARVLAAVTVAVVVVVVAVVREPPVVATTAPAVRSPTAVAPRPPSTFYLLSAAFALMLLSQTSAVTHLLTIASDRGIGDAGLALTAVAAASVAGRLGGIPLLAGLGLLRFSGAVAVLQVLAMVLIATAGSLTMLIVGSALLGITLGNVVVLMPLHMLAAYGLASFERLFARLNLVTTFGACGAPLLLGWLHDRLGGYGVPVLLLAAGSALSAGLLVLARVDSAGRWFARPGLAIPVQRSAAPAEPESAISPAAGSCR